jgi:hypothetical protein
MALRHGGEVQMETIEQLQADVNKLEELFAADLRARERPE